GPLYGRNRFRDTLFVELRIGGNNLVGVPVRLTLGYAGTFGVQHFSLVAYLVPDPLQDAHATPGFAAVAAQMDVGRIGTDDGDTLRRAEIERQQAVLVFQQGDGLMRRLQCQLLVRRSVAHRVGALRIYVRMIEQTKLELRPQHASCRLVYQ